MWPNMTCLCCLSKFVSIVQLHQYSCVCHILMTQQWTRPVLFSWWVFRMDKLNSDGHLLTPVLLFIMPSPPTAVVSAALWLQTKPLPAALFQSQLQMWLFVTSVFKVWSVVTSWEICVLQWSHFKVSGYSIMTEINLFVFSYLMHPQSRCGGVFFFFLL